MISACADVPTESSAAAAGELRRGVGVGGTTLSIRAGERVMVFLEGANAAGCESVALGGAVSQQVFAQVGNCAGAAAIGTRVQSQQAAADGWVSFSLPASGGGQVQVTEVPGAIQVYRVAMDDADSDSDFDDVRLRVEVHADVRDFGANPFDYVDDRPVIQSVLDNASYRSIYFDPGTYVLHSALNVRRSGVRLWGPLNPDGSRPARLYKVGGSVNVDSSSAVYVGRPNQTNNVVIEQLFFQGEFVDNAFAVLVVYGDSVRFSNNRVRNIGALRTAPPGLGSDPNHYLWVEHNLIDNDPQYLKAGAFGVQIEYSRHAWVRHNQIYNVGHGIQWWGGGADPDIAGYRPGVFAVREVQIDSNTVVNTGAGIWGSMGQQIKVRGNHVEHCHDVCLDAEGGTDIVFSDNTAMNAGTAVLAVYFGATAVQFLNNRVEQKGADSSYGNPAPCGAWPVGRVMFAMLRGCSRLAEPNDEQTMLLSGNTFTYRGREDSANPEQAVGELRKLSSSWIGVQHNKMTNTVINFGLRDDVVGDNNGGIDVTNNRLSFTRPTGGRPAIYAANSHKGGAYAPSMVVVTNNEITSTVSQDTWISRKPAIRVLQSASAWTIGSRIGDNVLGSSGFGWNVEFQNDNAAHHWYIFNNGGNIRQLGNTAPYLVAPPS